VPGSTRMETGPAPGAPTRTGRALTFDLTMIIAMDSPELVLTAGQTWYVFRPSPKYKSNIRPSST